MQRLVNCHTHIFTGDHVPPYLAKTYIPWPFYYLLPLSLFVNFFRWWYKYPARYRYRSWYKMYVRRKIAINSLLNRFGPLTSAVGYLMTFWAVLYLNDLLGHLDPSLNIRWLALLKTWLRDHYLLWDPASLVWKLIIVLLILLFFASVRNLFLFIARRLWRLLAMLPGKETSELFARYLTIGRYAFHLHQESVLSKLKAQYPQGTGFVVLPMDMEYMAAGKVNKRYRDQIAEITGLLNRKEHQESLIPFLFIDPRRITEPELEKSARAGDKIFFSYSIEEGAVVLKDCLVRDCLAAGYRGFKLYPALGYYPFDERLLPLWKYAADNNIPILTHCIRGTIFYRGTKKAEWNSHPVFEEANYQDHYVPLALPEMDNFDFTANFTHPMNYLCLLEEPLLRKIVHAAVDQDPESLLRDVFGYTDAITPLKSDLSALKICLAHFGGDDEWIRYFEKDRYDFSSQLIRYPFEGIDFFNTVRGTPAPGKPEQLWKYTDWYSLICSMMLRHEQVYADISYILHADTVILPLLKQTLQNPKLRSKVLYGSDFFVVRNHKSDKQLVADMLGGLSVDDFDQIARINPQEFLFTNLHGALPGGE